MKSDLTENTAPNSSSVVGVRCGEVFTERLPSNGLVVPFCWVHESAFQALCHDIILPLRFYPSKIDYIFLVSDTLHVPHLSYPLTDRSNSSSFIVWSYSICNCFWPSVAFFRRNKNNRIIEDEK
jgi:hypothetical protein